MKRLISSRPPSRAANLDGPLRFHRGTVSVFAGLGLVRDRARHAPHAFLSAIYWRVLQSCRKINKRAWGEPGEQDAYFCYFQTSDAIRKSTGSRAQGGTSVATRRFPGLGRISDHRTKPVAAPEGGQPRQASCDRTGPPPSPRAGDEPALARPWEAGRVEQPPPGSPLCTQGTGPGSWLPLLGISGRVAGTVSGRITVGRRRGLSGGRGYGPTLPRPCCLQGGHRAVCRGT